MTNYIILFLCLIVLIAYLFDITSKYTKIPGVVLLIFLGIAIRMLADSSQWRIPNLEPYLPVIGTLGLIMIVMEASLDLKLQKNKIKLINQSVASAIILLASFLILFSYILVRFMGIPPLYALMTGIPLGIIGSTVAIPSAGRLRADQKDFVVYESSISDIIGILLFDFVLINHESIVSGLLMFTLKGLITVILSSVLTAGLAFLLHKATYHINYVIIMTAVVMTYVLGKIAHLPALFLVLVFGLALSNNRYMENTLIRRWVDFDKFRTDVSIFQKTLRELTFLIRSFFFIMFGYYTKLEGLFYLDNLVSALIIILGIVLLRWIYFTTVLKMPAIPLVFFAPRGLITILLYLSLPVSFRIPFITEEVITLVIFMSVLVMTMGNMLHRNTVVKVVSVT